MLSIAVVICYVWYAILSRPSKVEDEFRHSETLQLLQIIIGFTYLGVIRSFFDSLREKTSLTAELCTVWDQRENGLPDDFVNKLIGIHTKSTRSSKETDSWTYWNEEIANPVPDRYKQIFTRVVVADNADHGQLFSLLGPWFAIGVFYLFHPPVAYREDGSVTAWVLIYSVSISILFSFLMTMWIVERAVDFGLIRRDGCFYDCTLQYYMEIKTKHMRSSSMRGLGFGSRGASRGDSMTPYVPTAMRRGKLLL